MATIRTTERLGRSLGFFQTFAIGTGTMIGAGIFILPGIAISAAGPAAILSFLFGGVISMATAISMAELATGMPKAGGSYYFISRAMGAAFGAVVGLGAWLGLVFKGSFALIGLGDYLYVMTPVPVLLTAVAAGFIFLVINYRGAKGSASFQNLIVIFLILIMVWFIVRGFSIAETSKFTPFVPFGYTSIFATTGLIFISYLGITELASVSEEVKNPSRNLPLALIASVGVVTLLYLGVMIVISGVLTFEESLNTYTPLVDVAEMIAGDYGKVLIVIAGLLATVSTANAAILSSSRFPFAMSRDDLIPRWFVSIHQRYDTPHNAILATGIVMILLLLLFNVEQLARLGGTFNLLMFVLINSSVIILRNRPLDEYKPAFRDPFFPYTQIIGIIFSLALLPTMGALPLFFSIIVILAGMLWYKYYGKAKAFPKYDIFDVLENNTQPVPLESDSNIKILVPLANPRHEMDLLYLADNLGDEVIGLSVIKVPQQTSLTAAREAFHEKRLAIDGVLKERFEQFPTIVGHEREYIIAFDHSITNSIMEQAEIEKVDFMIIGWHETNRFHPSMGTIANKVLSFAKNNMVVLNGYLPPKIGRIVIAYNGKENSQYGLHLARRLSKSTGAPLHVLRVMKTHLREELKGSIMQDMEELARDDSLVTIVPHVKEHFSAENAILDFLCDDDLLIIGDSSGRFKFSLIGNLPYVLAKRYKGPVMIVRKHKPLSSEGVNNILLKRVKRLKFYTDRLQEKLMP
ncbi:amino acid permease [Methanolobus chelungpuianus]|uniref:Amino acid permease n=1 Tax=Methanolobus chelungpuianus TaxID=502115 RepID=A0AAE3H9H8_9EURY|nr:amino acid permease [Methanolobus chelungpuianus]MCQ6961994.1 amino acid permease [Methanolobus chelungpuianus]